MKRINFIILLLFLLSGCDKESEDIVNHGEITLSSEFQGSDNRIYRYGYSFEKTKFFEVPVVSENKRPDIFLEDLPIPGGDTFVAFIYSEESNSNGIFKNGDFDNLVEAELFFNNYEELIDDSWSALSDTIENFQVYTFKTSENNYVKLLIQDVRLFDNISSPGFMEIDLKYFIQRDGTTVFSEN